MEITAYFTEDLPAPFNATARQVRDLLEEYEAASNGRIVVRFVNPDSDELAAEADSEGVRRVAHQNIEDDAVSVVEGYRGLVIHYLDEKSVLPVIQSSDGLEYTLTMAIKEMVGEKTRIGLLEGHGQPTLAEGLSSFAAALPTYEVVSVNGAEPIDGTLTALLVVGPNDALEEDELRNIESFVMAGGSLGVFGGGSHVDLSAGQPSASAVDSGLNRLLGAWGVTLRQNVVGDMQCERAPYPTPMGIRIPVAYPPLPITAISDEEREHPVLFRLPSVTLPFSSTLEIGEAPEGVEVTTLIHSSESSWSIEGGAMDLSIRASVREWNPRPPFGPFPLAAAIEGEVPAVLTGEGKASQSVRVLVVGSSTVIRDELMPRAQPGQPPEITAARALGLNAVDWLAADSDLIAIRAKSVEEPALEVPTEVVAAEEAALSAAEDQNELAVDEALEERQAAIASWDSKKSAYRWINGLGLPVAFAIFGMLRWRRRKSLRESVRI